MNIFKVEASDFLLKLYFSDLYSRINVFSDFLIDEINYSSLIVNFNDSNLNATELFSCIKINRRWYEEPFTNYIPKYLYYLSSNELDANDFTFVNHPFLYANIYSIDNTPLFEAELTLHNTASDLINSKGEILNTFCANLYDNGSFRIEALDSNLLVVAYFDENNAEWIDLFSFKDQKSLIPIYQLYDKERILFYITVKQFPGIIKMVDPNLLNDKEILIAVLNFDTIYIEYIKDELSDNREFMLFALMKSSTSFIYASNRLKEDFDFVAAALSHDGKLLRFVSDGFKNNINLTLIAVANSGSALEFVGNSLIEDSRLLTIAIINDYKAIKYVPKNIDNFWYYASIALSKSGNALQYLDATYQDDKEFVLRAVANSGIAIKFANIRFIHDYDVVITAVANNGLALEYVSDFYKNDYLIASIAAHNNEDALKFVSSDLKLNEEFKSQFTYNFSNNRYFIEPLNSIPNIEEGSDIDDCLPF